MGTFCAYHHVAGGMIYAVLALFRNLRKKTRCYAPKDGTKGGYWAFDIGMLWLKTHPVNLKEVITQLVICDPYP